MLNSARVSGLSRAGIPQIVTENDPCPDALLPFWNTNKASGEQTVQLISKYHYF